MPGETLDANINELQMEGNETRKEINVDELQGRVCYFSLSGDLALKAFEDIRLSTYKKEKKRKKLKEELTKRLFLAVAMFDKVVLHCSDPLRSEIVLEVLELYSSWIKEGKILFIFSNHIKNIKKDYRKYIDDKVQEYSDGYNSKAEAESLTQPHMNDAYYEKVIDILNLSTCIVRKSKNKEYDFKKLVLNDILHQHENIIIDSSLEISQVLSLSLTLGQLLHIRTVTCSNEDSSCKNEFLFPNEIIENVVDKVEEHLTQDNTIARAAIVDSLKDSLKQFTKKQKNILKAITLRMDVLYCRMNSGEQLILEFHPSFEYRSIYQVECFKEYISLVSHSDKMNCLSYDMINMIINNEKINDFRLCFISSMADTQEHMKLSQIDTNKEHDFFLNKFIEIAKNNGAEMIFCKN